MRFYGAMGYGTMEVGYVMLIELTFNIWADLFDFSQKPVIRVEKRREIVKKGGSKQSRLSVCLLSLSLIAVYLLFNVDCRGAGGAGLRGG